MKNKPKNFIEAKAKYEGGEYETLRYGKVKVIEYRSTADIVVQFENTGYVTTVSIGNLKKGFVKDKSIPTVCNFGIIGDHNIRDECGNIEKEYRRWESMLSRVYGRPTKTYLGCEVCLNFQKYKDFKDWCSKQIGFNSKDDKGKPFALDKDILIKGNKVYSPETCCFVPAEINSLFVKQPNIRGEYPLGVSYEKRTKRFHARISIFGKNIGLGTYSTPEEAFQAYKTVKEDHIKEVAIRWKDQIDPRVYEALMKYEVAIDD